MEPAPPRLSPEYGKKSSALEYYCRAPLIGDPHERLIGDPQIFNEDPNLFIEDPHIYI